MNVVKKPPAELEPSKFHVRQNHTAQLKRLTASIEKVGLINPPIGRNETGQVRLIDGVRRARAARKAGVKLIPVVVREIDNDEARVESVMLNADTGTANNKSVTDDDRDSAFKKIGEKTNSSREEIKHKIGLLSEAERIEMALEPVPGVGLKIATNIADVYTLEQLTGENVQLQSVDGVGEKTASAIRSYLSQK